MTFISFILFYLFSNLLFAQSPWTENKGEFYTQFSFSTIPSYNEIFGNPDYFSNRNITDDTFQLYGEYGISGKTTLILNIPFKNITTSDILNPIPLDPSIINGDTRNAFGNIEAGIKQNFITKKWLLTGQLNIEINTSSYDDISGIRTGYDAFTFTPLINFGRSFNKSYLQGFTGFNLRTNNYSSNFKIGAEGGTKVFNRIWLIAFLDFVISLENGSIELPIENQLTALYVNNQEYTAFGLKFIGEITPDFGLIAGFGGAFSGNNVAKQAAINVGIYMKFKSD
ncbi:MAG: hypothetical protein COB12_07770 [Flavobacterium sp.]|nr:MAG: hypothetical protein COB12_07770 [Flavobacterium sp.]